MEWVFKKKNVFILLNVLDKAKKRYMLDVDI